MIARRLARAFGYDLIPRRKLKDLDAQLVATLERQAVDAVIDVGANLGQYATRLREAGWRGPVLSIEPIPELRAALARGPPPTRPGDRTGHGDRGGERRGPLSRCRPRAT